MDTNELEASRLLIVDDTPNNIKVLVPIFLGSGEYKINVANNGTQALEMVDKVKPDLILLDIMMPDIDGYEVCRRLKSKNETKDIPVIFLSAKSQTEDLAKGFELGASDYVTKPFNSVELLARVKTHLELKRSRDLIRTRLEGLVQERTKDLEKEIEERIRLQEQLQQSKKLESIGQLAGGVAHDFNNQLAGIIGAAELLAMRIKEEKSVKYINMILKAARNSADLTKQLLAFARKGKERVANIELNAVINESIQLLERSLDKNIDIAFEASALKRVTQGDPTQVENAVLNIAINAGHAMVDGGTLKFQLSSEEIDSDHRLLKSFTMEPGTYHKLTVSDTGTGMNQEVIEKIFDPFFTTKEQGKGTGMGLAAVYGTVTSHGGAIEVESTIGQGSKFHLYFLSYLGEALETHSEDEELTNVDHKKMMIVDDEEIVLETCKSILEELGHEVTEFLNGLDAIEFYKENWRSIDLVILDKIMPKIGGKDLFIALKKINPDVQAILASGYSEEKAQEVLDLGVKEFIQKPFTVSTLMKTVDKLC